MLDAGIPSGNLSLFSKVVMDAPAVKRRRFNWVTSDSVRKALKFYYEWSARLKGQRFYCSALCGESDYNITVNCDLTVSCNCQDYDGSGHFGDLNKTTFKEAFFGPQAAHIRTELAKGKIPIISCTRCCDLKRVPKSQVRAEPPLAGSTEPQLLAGPPPRLPPRGMLLENTVRCI